MKKALFAFFVVLMLFAFVGCDNTEIEDVAGASEGFIETYKNAFNSGVLNYLHVQTDDKGIELSDYDSGVGAQLMEGIERYLICEVNGDDYEKFKDSISVSTAKGRIICTNKREGDLLKDHIVVDNLIVRISYEKKTAELRLSGDFYMEYGYTDETMDEGFGSCYVKSMSFNGKQYKDISAEVKILKSSALFTSAKCDGVTVSLDVINNAELL